MTTSVNDGVKHTVPKIISASYEQTGVRMFNISALNIDFGVPIMHKQCTESENQSTEVLFQCTDVA